MHNIIIMQKDIKYDFNINRIKIIYGNDYNKKYNFIQLMKKSILSKQSEYDEDNNINSTFMFDDNINSNFEIYEVSGSYDIETDLKLNIKSLSHKYLASIINDIEYDETFSTLKVLFNDLNNLYLNDISISLNDKNVSYNIDFTINDLLKLINCTVKKNDLVQSIYDLSYEEMVLQVI